MVICNLTRGIAQLLLRSVSKRCENRSFLSSWLNPLQEKEIEMVPVTMLWLPILVSAVFVFIASNILWMMLPFWHRADYGKLPDEKTVLDALSSVKNGQYIVPCVDWGKLTPEQRAEMQRGPSALLLLRNPATFRFGKILPLWLLYIVVISIFVAYLTGIARAAGTPYLEVFRVAGAAAVLAYTFRTIPEAIWYGKPWKVVFKEMIDGTIYGLLTAGAFGWLWPK
jgi:nucleoside recognition membrane protein YjiH